MAPEKVAIVSVAQTKYEAAKRDKELNEIIFGVTKEALDKAGLSRDEVDSVVIAAHDLVDGRSISDMQTATAAGAYLKDGIRVCEDGIFAALLAYARILSGMFGISLVVSWGKSSETETSLDVVTNLNFDPIYHRSLGLNEISAHAIQASRYMKEYGISEKQNARVVVKNRQNAVNNPLAHLRSPVTLDEVLKSPTVSWPLKRLDTPPRSDGACALVMAPETKAKEISKNPVWIRGVSWCADSYYLGDRNLAELKSLRIAASRAYQMAGITDPTSEIDVAEIFDLFSFLELMEYEALGFCEMGGGGRFIEAGIPEIKGKLPVNPSGGVLSSNPCTPSGLIRLAEASLQVMGKAERRQIPDVKVAVAHGISGICGQSHCVFVIGK